jgi:hypothetical protein
VFSFVGPCRPYIPCNLQDDSTTEGTSDITRSFFWVAMVCQAVTCAFDASRFEVAIIFGVPRFLTVCTLRSILFVFGLNFIFHCCIYSTLNMSLFGAHFSSTKNRESDSLVLYCLIFQTSCTRHALQCQSKTPLPLDIA